MEVKIDTKERFHVITPLQEHFSATMAGDIARACDGFLQSPVKSVVLNLGPITYMSESGWEQLLGLQEKHYQENASFVTCCIAEPSMNKLKNTEGLYEVLQYAPTESEAADLVQMEDIERDMIGEEA